MMSANFKILLIVSIFLSCSYCYSFNTKNVLVIPHKKIHDSYFGYSLLLQTGNLSMVIVGAPKDSVLNDVHHGGQVYQCRLDENKPCTPLISTKDMYNSLYNPNGDFFGGAIDGEGHINGAVMACSPRASVLQKKLSKNKQEQVYTPGSCIYSKESLKTESIIINASRFFNNYNSRPEAETNKTYFDIGYALFGFDISFFNKDSVLVGAPGIKNLNGATISFSPTSTKFDGVRARVDVLPKRRRPVWSEEDSYFGYSVDSQIFQHSSNDVWFLAGEPRGSNLTGKALLYRYNHENDNLTTKLACFNGADFGSYFGASVLAVDISNDENVDILIGAPMAAGQTYDEGLVCFYKGSSNISPVGFTECPMQLDTFLPCMKLTGSNQKGSRFGTTMVSLGDFDLDGYNDVAISAPYENDGEGVVYIYRGRSDGLINEYSQKLTPSKFSVSVPAKGFGLGISKGNDIDKNGHNDIAIGAYKTDQVFIVYSHSIIDYQVSLTRSTDGLIQGKTNFSVTLCLNYTTRSKVLILPEVEFNIEVELDYRSSEDLINKNINAKLEENICESYNIKIPKYHSDVSPFNVDLYVELSAKHKNIIAEGSHKLKLQVPYTLGCLDEICITGLTVEVNSKSTQITVGQSKPFDLHILVNNDGEPAFMCELLIKVPAGLRLRNIKDCIEDNKNYICLVADKLDKSVTVDFIFDVNFTYSHVGYLEIQVSARSIGKNKKDYKNQDVYKIHVIADIISYVSGKSVPETIEINGGNGLKDYDVTYEFTVGSIGLLPIKLNLDILLPNVQYNGENIFHIISVKGTLSTDQVQCYQTGESVVNWNTILPEIDVPEDKTIMVHCKNSACSQFSCYGDYLNTSEQTAVIEVKMVVVSKHLVSQFSSELRQTNLIAYIPIVIQKNSNDTDDGIIESTPLRIYIDIKSIPLWAYLVAAICAIVSFILIVVSLYKCSFFSRTYKDKLEHEQLLNTDNPGEDNEYLTRSMAPVENDDGYIETFTLTHSIIPLKAAPLKENQDKEYYLLEKDNRNNDYYSLANEGEDK